MTHIDVQHISLLAPNVDLHPTTSANVRATASQVYAVTDQSQQEWHRHLAAAEMQFTLTNGCLFVGPDDAESAVSFDRLTQHDPAPFHDNDHDNEIDNAIRVAKQAKRKAQNRMAQRKFRERRDHQVKALEAEIVDLKEHIDESRSQILDLQAALNTAQTQLDTLKSIIPVIAKYSGTELRI